MKIKEGDILIGINPYSWEEEEYKFLGLVSKENDFMLYNSGFKYRLEEKNGGKIIVTKAWLKERGVEVKK